MVVLFNFIVSLVLFCYCSSVFFFVITLNFLLYFVISIYTSCITVNTYLWCIKLFSQNYGDLYHIRTNWLCVLTVIFVPLSFEKEFLIIYFLNVKKKIIIIEKKTMVMIKLLLKWKTHYCCLYLKIYIFLKYI